MRTYHLNRKLVVDLQYVYMFNKPVLLYQITFYIERTHELFDRTSLYMALLNLHVSLHIYAYTRILDFSLLLMLCIFVQGCIGYLISCSAGMTYLMIQLLTQCNYCEKFMI